MAAYMLFIREGAVRDQAQIDTYRRMNAEGPRDPKLTPLAVYGSIEALEGPVPDAVVLLKFPTVEDAKAWYNSPGYQAALPHRKAGAEYRALIIQGL
jgi:uncharacterized protein (DUF1330 family)